MEMQELRQSIQERSDKTVHSLNGHFARSAQIPIESSNSLLY